MVKIKRLKTTSEFIEYTRLFNKAIGYSNVPWQYYASGKIWALYNDKNEIKGGFVLVSGYFNLRSILQIPEVWQIDFYEKHNKIATNLCDNTGYFINTTSFKDGILFTLFMVLVCAFYHKKYFVYTYPVSDVALEKYYANGNPFRIHTGVPVYLPGHSAEMEAERVEILTRWGLAKIWYYRTKRMIKMQRLLKNRKK